MVTVVMIRIVTVTVTSGMVTLIKVTVVILWRLSTYNRTNDGITSHSTLHTCHFSLLPSHSKLKLHTPHFTLLTSHCFLHTAHFTLHSPHFTALNLRATASENCSSKTGWISTPERKKTILKHFLKGCLKGKLLAPKWRKSADKSLSQPSCSHSNTIYEVQLQKTIVLRMQPRHQATLTQLLQCDLRRLGCETQ